MKQVVIFRHQLFKISEPFIAQQAGSLERYQPTYVGRERFGTAPAGFNALSLSDVPANKTPLARIWQVATRNTKPYTSLLQSGRPALIHAHFGVDAVYALPLARKLNVPLVTTFHGFDVTTSRLALLRSGSPSWINYLRLRGQLARRGDLFLCVSEAIRKRALALGFPEDRMHVHYIGIDSQAITPRSIDDETPVILHVARLTPKKGTQYLLRAFAMIPKEQRRCKLMIIGEGPLRESLQTLAMELGISEQVQFLGAQPNSVVMQWLRKCLFLAVPSVTARSGDAEGLPIVLLEAAAMGVPVVGTLHSGIPEAVMNGKTGLLVAERDVPALASSMQALLRSRERRAQMGMAARRFVETRFELREQTRQLEKLYDRVLS